MGCLFNSYFFVDSVTNSVYLHLGLAWAVIPQTFEYGSENFHFNSWRLFTVLCGVPSLSVAISMIFLPESPRYLLTRGDEEGALEVFRRIYTSNTGLPASQYPVISLSNQHSNYNY